MNCLSESEANVSWLNSKGTWVTYVIMIAFLHFLLLCVLTVPLAWTLTNVINSLVSPSLALYHYHTFFLLPICGLSTNVLLQMDQGAASRLTHWEQMDEKYLQSKKFLCTVPTVLFILASFYTRYNFHHFIWNFIALLVALIPKLPQLHKFRLWGINKY